MIDIKLYEKDASYQNLCRTSLKNRGGDLAVLDTLVQWNQKRKKLIFDIEGLIVERKQIEKNLVSSKNKNEEQIQSAQALGKKISELQEQLKQAEDKIFSIALQIPNVCHSSAPVGSSSKDNSVVRKFGEPSVFSFPVLSHLDLAGECIDSVRAVKVTGSRFAFLRGEAAQLERALMLYMLEKHIKDHGYEEIQTPFMVNESSLIHTGQLPKFKEDLFLIEEHKRYLIPTAEVSVTNFYANEILSEKDLPLKFVSYSPCFRSEAGSYGKDTKGLLRQHQFTKVELVVFSHPDCSYQILEELTGHAEKILIDLEIPYRVVNLCTGDLGFSSAKCYDIEVWLPFEREYREISSCSNCEDYQARRGKIRFRSDSADGVSKKGFVHTLNGSGLAVGRTLIAVLENYQNEDGSVRVPKVLQPYMDGKQVILKSKK